MEGPQSHPHLSSQPCCRVGWPVPDWEPVGDRDLSRIQCEGVDSSKQPFSAWELICEVSREAVIPADPRVYQEAGIPTIGRNAGLSSTLPPPSGLIWGQCLDRLPTCKPCIFFYLFLSEKTRFTFLLELWGGQDSGESSGFYCGRGAARGKVPAQTRG